MSLVAVLVVAVSFMVVATVVVAIATVVVAIALSSSAVGTVVASWDHGGQLLQPLVLGGVPSQPRVHLAVVVSCEGLQLVDLSQCSCSARCSGPLLVLPATCRSWKLQCRCSSTLLVVLMEIAVPYVVANC